MQPLKPHISLTPHITAKPILQINTANMLSSGDIKGLFTAELMKATKAVSRTESASVNTQTNTGSMRSGVFMPGAATGMPSSSAQGSKSRSSISRKRNTSTHSKPQR